MGQAGRRRLPAATRQPGYLAAVHRRSRGVVPQHQVDRRVSGRRADQRRQGQLQQLRDQEEGRARARRQVQQINKTCYEFNTDMGTIKMCPGKKKSSLGKKKKKKKKKKSTRVDTTA